MSLFSKYDLYLLCILFKIYSKTFKHENIGNSDLQNIGGYSHVRGREPNHLTQHEPDRAIGRAPDS